MFNDTFFRKLCRLLDNVEKHTAGEGTDDNMALAHCLLHTKDYKTHSEYVILIAFLLQQ